MSLYVKKAIGAYLLPTGVAEYAAHEIDPIIQMISQATVDRSMRRCFTSVSCKMLELVIYHHVFIHCEDYKTRGRAKLSQLIVMLGDQLQGADAHEQRLTYTNSRFQQNI